MSYLEPDIVFWIIHNQESRWEKRQSLIRRNWNGTNNLINAIIKMRCILSGGGFMMHVTNECSNTEMQTAVIISNV